jgi:hypothetical protein
MHGNNSVECFEIINFVCVWISKWKGPQHACSLAQPLLQEFAMHHEVSW